MSWTKHFRVVNAPNAYPANPEQQQDGRAGHGTSAKFSSYLPEVYAGHPNRIQRYYQYQDMDRDSDIALSLNLIADFCTQSEEQNHNPFKVEYLTDANETETTILKDALTKWVKINNFKTRLWKIFRMAAQNGDVFFLRDPETQEWLWMDHFSVEMVTVDGSAGKVPEDYIVRNLDINLNDKFATKVADLSQYRMPYGTNGPTSGKPMTNSNVVSGMFQLTGADRDLRQKNGASGVSEHYVIKAEHIVHLSLSEGLDINYPFGQSILEPIFKTFKQKELLEDSIIIYRVQRAPERRVFKIDCGQMSPQRARAHVEAVKNEIHQRRIPNRTGGGASVVDATYNPLATIEDYFFAVGSEGRGSSVETLPGGDNLGEIGDLTFFSKKMARGLGIPANYLSLSDDQTGGAAYNDGKMGAAMIQEFRFNKYCMRLQSLLASTFDKEFKKFLNINGFEIDSDLFELQFNPPQNFAKYRQIEIDTAQAQVYSSVSGNPKMAERMKFKKYLGWTDDDILENERLWREENPDKIKKKTGTTPAESNNEGDLSAVGIRPGDDFDMGGEMPTDDLGDDVGGDQPEGAAPPEGGAGAPPPAPDKPTL